MDRARKLAALGTTGGLAASRFIEQRIRAYDDNQPMEERNAAPVHDALCVAFMLNPDIVTTLFRHVDVETRRHPDGRPHGDRYALPERQGAELPRCLHG